MSVIEAEGVLGQAYETILRHVAAGTARALDVQDVLAHTPFELAPPAEAQQFAAALVDLARHAATEPERALTDREIAGRRLAWAVANRLYEQARLVPGVTSVR